MPNDMASVTAPKSDQINADDFLSGPQVFTITAVKIIGGAEQPVSISLEGTPKAWRPCKTTCRVMMAIWGDDTSRYIGRSVKLYRDPNVKWGGLAVGGIRISEMSDMEGGKPVTLALTETRGFRKPAVIRPLAIERRRDAAQDDATAEMHRAEARNAARQGTAHFREWWASDKGKLMRDAAKAIMPDLQKLCDEADTAPKEDDPFGLPPLADGDTPTPEQIAAANAEAEAAARAEAAKYTDAGEITGGGK